MGRMRLVQVAEKVVDEMRQRFGNGHDSHNANQRTDWTRT
jgi:hypothetical protein